MRVPGSSNNEQAGAEEVQRAQIRGGVESVEVGGERAICTSSVLFRPGSARRNWAPLLFAHCTAHKGSMDGCLKQEGSQ